MKSIIVMFLTFLYLGLTTNIFSQNYIMELYPGGEIPNQKSTEEKEKRDTTDIVRISQVQIPDIAVFLPSKKNATGDAVIICPGGGYRLLAYDWEGTDIARFWNSKGVAAIVLKYRLPDTESQIVPWESPMIDARRAMRTVRYNAEAWNIHPNRIGIMGFSAGGHLASTLSTHFDAGNPDSHDPIEKQSCRPDFSILIYPVISFSSEYTHIGSRNAMLGENPNSELMKFFSPEKQISKTTPPAILIHSADDKSVPVENSISYLRALLTQGISAEMHIYPYGGHGYSLAIGKGQLSSWPERCYEWLNGL